MKDKILNSIKDFANTCYTMFKIGAGDFAKEKFPTLVENFYDENKSDAENLKIIRNMFECNIILNESRGNNEAVKCIKAFLEGWYNKIENDI